MTAAACPHGNRYTTCNLCAATAKAHGGDELRQWWKARAIEKCDSRFPRRYLPAEATEPAVLAWVKAFHTDPDTCPSLLITGPVGTGKTWQAYGALRAAAVCGRNVTWQATTFADLAAALRPVNRDDKGQSPRRDPEAVMADYRNANLLLLDDLGAAKGSEWVEEVAYRLINGRYEDMRPSIFTTNIPLPNLRAGLGDRIASRLVEMCGDPIALTGKDRRRERRAAA